jgi:hypothetical protein
VPVAASSDLATAGVVSSTFAADQQLIQLHRDRQVAEREAAYAAACDRMAARPNGYCVISECMKDVYKAERLLCTPASSPIDSVVTERMAAYERACAVLLHTYDSSPCSACVRVDS